MWNIDNQYMSMALFMRMVIWELKDIYIAYV